jgi:hypothetical protein
MTRLTFSLRRKWRNDTGNQGIDPLQIVRPTTLEEVVGIIHDAEREGVTVRAVGSGHSWSDVALTRGFLIQPTGITRPLSLEEDLLKSDRVHAERLVRAEAGMRIRELNSHLDSLGLALRNMGGYDGQTIAGVISTSTHGSGLSFGPITDDVRSLDVVAAGGRLLRIEPSDGITDPRAFKDNRSPEWKLVQNDTAFNAVRVGMGCLGVIYSVILVVRDRFYLREVRRMSTWTQVREQLLQGALLADNSHCEIYFNPYERDGEHSCLITTRNERTREQYDRDPHRTRHILAEFLSTLSITPKIINLIQGLRPSVSPAMINRALTELADRDYTNVSYKVLNIGTANDLPAYSAEIGIPIDERGLHIKAVETVFAVAARHARLGGAYQSSPISLRFVHASEALLSMMNGCDTMMIELIMLTHTEGGFELLADYEEALYELGGRPHWGQVNTLTGSDGLITAMYPHFAEWLAIERGLNHSGVFDSPFTKRVGISASRFMKIPTPGGVDDVEL